MAEGKWTAVGEIARASQAIESVVCQGKEIVSIRIA